MSEALLEKYHRGVRRHHRSRLMKNRRHILGGIAGRRRPDAVLSMWARTPTPCSCSMCGNPRRHAWGQPLTMAELRENDRFFTFECESV